MLLLFAYIAYFSVAIAMLYFDLMAAYHLTMLGLGVGAMHLLLIVIKPMRAVFQSRTAIVFFMAGVIACALIIDWVIIFTAPLLYLAVGDAGKGNSIEIEDVEYPRCDKHDGDIHAMNKDAFLNPSNVLYETMVGPVGKLEKD